MATIHVREYPFPESARHPCQHNQHSYFVAGRGFSIGILYALEPFNEDGSSAIHVSVSYCKSGRPSMITSAVLKVVEELITQQSLRWPTRFVQDVFDTGQFAGVGIHLWETA